MYSVMQHFATPVMHITNMLLCFWYGMDDGVGPCEGRGLIGRALCVCVRRVSNAS